MKSTGEGIGLPVTLSTMPMDTYEQIVTKTASDDPELPRQINAYVAKLVPDRPDMGGGFWEQSAQMVLASVMLHIATSPTYEGRRTVESVREFLVRDAPADWESAATNPAFSNDIQMGIELMKESTSGKATRASILATARIAIEKVLRDKPPH